MQKIIYMDDMEDADVEADGGTLRFSLEGTDYEIDLSKKNATKLRSVLGPFVAAARVSGKKFNRPSKPGAPSVLASGYNSDQLTAIRTWANGNGFTVSLRGRVPADVIEAFEKAGGLSVIKDVTDPPVASKKPAFTAAAN